VEMERNQACGAAHHDVESQSELDAADGAAQTNSVAAHAFGDDDAFVEIPLLRVGCEEEHQLGVFAHAAQAFAAAEHEPHVGGFEGDLTFSGFKIVARYGSYALKLDPL